MMLAVISYPPIPIFNVGPVRLSLHGLFAAIGFVIGGWIATKELRRRGGDTVKYQSCLSWGLVGALLGARYMTVPAQLAGGASIVDALNPFGGNFSILGGLAGGIIAGAYRMRGLGMPILATLDASSFGLALGTVVGRIGDLAIVEHLGRATEASWGYGIKPGYDLAPQHDLLECTAATAGPDGLCGVYHHVAAYDLLGAGILLAALWLVGRRLKLRDGQLFWIWVAWYGLQRFVLDGLRFGNGDATIGRFTWNQISGLLVGLAAMAILAARTRRRSLAPPPNRR